MAYLLRILLAVTMMSLCIAQCMREKNAKLNYNNHNKKHAFYKQHKHGCWKDGEFHEVGHEWKLSDCTTCTCNGDHIMCCTDYAKPVLKDQVNCEAILNKNTCKVEVKRKDNTDKICEIESWIA